MSRISDGTKRKTLVAMLLGTALLGSGCKELEGRQGNRQGNALFREMQFIDAAAEYERALKTVKSPIVHYNLGLSYSKIYRPGYDKPIRLGEQTDPVCDAIPGLEKSPVPVSVCIKRGDEPDQKDRRRFVDCSELTELEHMLATRQLPDGERQQLEGKREQLESEKDAEWDAIEKQLQDKNLPEKTKAELEAKLQGLEAIRDVDICPPSFECRRTTMCTATSAHLAGLAGNNLQEWIKLQPSDDSLKAERLEVAKQQKVVQEKHEANMKAIREEQQATRAAHEQTLAGLAADHQARLAKIRAQREADKASHEAILAKLKAEHEPRLAKLREEQKAAQVQIAQKLAPLKAEQQQRIAKAKAEHEQRLAKLKVEHEKRLAKLPAPPAAPEPAPPEPPQGAGSAAGAKAAGAKTAAAAPAPAAGAGAAPAPAAGAGSAAVAAAGSAAAPVAAAPVAAAPAAAAPAPGAPAADDPDKALIERKRAWYTSRYEAAEKREIQRFKNLESKEAQAYKEAENKELQKYKDAENREIQTYKEAENNENARFMLAETKELERYKDVETKEIARFMGPENRELQRYKTEIDPLNKQYDDLTLKDDMRKLMTQAWIDTNQHDKALTYWESELAAKPKDAADISNTIAGIHLKANNWRKSVEWYLKVSDLEQDKDQKVVALNAIGNIAWSKLNSKTLDINDSIELADYGIGALQKATTIDPKLPKLYSLQASILNFRSLTHGASFASAIDRSNAQDLLKLHRVLNDEAKKLKGQAPAPAPAPTTPSPAPMLPAPATPPALAPAPATPPGPGGQIPKAGG